MFYYVKVNGQFVVSPAYGKYELSDTRLASTYLWQTEASAKADTRWQHLVKAGDTVEYVRTYRS